MTNMKRGDKEALSWSPESWDYHLQDQYNISLYYFALSIFDIYSWIDKRNVKKLALFNSNNPASYKEFFNDRIQNLISIQAALKTIYKNWKSYNLNMSLILPKNIKYETAGADIYLFFRLISEAFSQLINRLIKYIESYGAKDLGRGRGIDNFKILFLTWSCFFNRNGKTNVTDLALFLKWILKRVSLIEQRSFTLGILNKELYRYRHRNFDKFILKDFVPDYFIIRFRDYLRKIPTYKENKKIDSNSPMIIFSNGEKLTHKECYDNSKLLDRKKIHSPFCLDFNIKSKYPYLLSSSFNETFNKILRYFPQTIEK